ncbi:hypothetical protein T4B_12002 [Trichinella pseudospiralis]|uniref:Uncharacterized protein n=1 Tax=Trichinella pseudospiralis TaxID=6337 RepID=A0A0V1K5N9_TRIPS|nr:hypothetical protein T4B_12002 [Trichinella pseudospiralis]KRZ42570.1 hypothetical protein T4C_316 [Trichinella pseudospiralis]
MKDYCFEMYIKVINYSKCWYKVGIPRFYKLPQLLITKQGTMETSGHATADDLRRANDVYAEKEECVEKYRIK